MRIVIQRVTSASVEIDKKIVASIGQGLMCLVGISKNDTEKEVARSIDKILKLRIFEDEQKKLNKSLQDIAGELLLVSQFTLYADCKKGTRPSFINAMAPADAEILYKKFVSECSARYEKTKSGVFQADMKVGLVNDGPITIVLDID